MKNLNIQFGAMAPSISIQLKRQKFKFEKAKVADFEEIFKAITRIWFAGYISTRSKNAMLDKLFRSIEIHIRANNKF